MTVFAIDPGGTIGVARIGPGDELLLFQTDDPLVVASYLTAEWQAGRLEAVLCEDYISGGALNRDAKHTIQQIGYFQGWCAFHGPTPFHTPVPQMRLSSVTQATAMAEALSSATAESRKHSIAALAHYLSWRRKHG